jgi:hypothetical protein
MSVIDDPAVTRRARGQIARRRGALIGLILIILGAWGALIPFIGPYFHFAYTPDHAWHWTASRGWLEVLPGVVTAFGGLLVLTSSSRATAVLGAWLAAAGGAWFAVGTSFEPIFHTGAIGLPASSSSALRVLESIGFFYGLGVVIVFFAATASGRLSVRSLADIHVAQRELDEEAGARIRARDAEAKPSDVNTSDNSLAGRHESHKRTNDSEPAPASIADQPVVDNPARNTDTTVLAQPDNYRPPGEGATAAPDSERLDNQPEQPRVRY